MTWRNRGLCSFPLARVWMDLHSADVSKLVLTAYTQAGHEEATRPVQELDENAPADAQPPPLGPWERLWDANATPAIMSLIEALADPAGAPGIEAGYHVVVAPLETAALALSPPAGTRLRVVLSDSPAPDPAEEALPGTGEMDVLYRAVAAGGESPHLPAVYRGLYRRDAPPA